MSRFNLVHAISRHPGTHGLNGFNDVIDTISWGLEQLGHEVSYAVNTFSFEATNIVFGAQVVPLEMLEAFPDCTIIYNFEQLRGVKPDEIVLQLRYCASRFKIWDYSFANLDLWRSIGATDVQVVPVGYAPILGKIPKVENQDIDVLLYGSPGQNRLNVFYELSQSGLTTVFVCGLYGSGRDNLIARSKIVLNINLIGSAKIFEIVRVSYLLANRKAVVADLDPSTFIEEDIKDSIKFSTLTDIQENCNLLINDNAKRIALEEAGFLSISKRDIRAILETALHKL